MGNGSWQWQFDNVHYIDPTRVQGERVANPGLRSQSRSGQFHSHGDDGVAARYNESAGESFSGIVDICHCLEYLHAVCEPDPAPDDDPHQYRSDGDAAVSL